MARTQVRSWRNWQTHQLEGLAVAIPWWFESTRPHQTPGPRVAAPGDALSAHTNFFFRTISALRNAQSVPAEFFSCLAFALDLRIIKGRAQRRLQSIFRLRNFPPHARPNYSGSMATE